MGTLERTESLTHRIGSNGRISIKTISGKLRIRGVDGDEARVTITYRIRATDQMAAERSLETGRVSIIRGPGSIEVESPERRLATGLAWLISGARVNADIAIDVPWGCKVQYETMSGSVEATTLVGEQKYRTVSGDIRLWSLGGLVDASSISGSVLLDRGGDVRIRANTASGAVRVRARRLYGTLLSTTSGGISIVGELDPSGDHRAESISGGVELTPLNGVTSELRAISGSIVSNMAHRLEGERGYWRSIVGDGRALFRVNSTSGGLRICAEQPGDRVVEESAPASAWTPPAAPTPPAPPMPPASPAAPPAPGTGKASKKAAVPVPEPGPQETAETWSPGESGSPEEDKASDEELAVLQALERGEIGVDEAAERLDRSRR